MYSKLGVDGIDLMERFPEEFTLLEGKEATMEGKQVKRGLLRKSMR